MCSPMWMNERDNVYWITMEETGLVFSALAVRKNLKFHSAERRTATSKQSEICYSMCTLGSEWVRTDCWSVPRAYVPHRQMEESKFTNSNWTCAIIYKPQFRISNKLQLKIRKVNTFNADYVYLYSFILTQPPYAYTYTNTYIYVMWSTYLTYRLATTA